MSDNSPEQIWWNGRIVPWKDAQVHVTSETALRGANVFEGVRAYWHQDTGRYAVVSLAEHLARLERSARLLRFPDLSPSFARDLATGVTELINACGYRQHLYLRPTLYIDQGRYAWKPEEVQLGTFITCHATDPRPRSAMSCIVSSWRRTPDLCLTPLAKTGAAYQAFRLPRIEAAMAHADEAILLNINNMVTETGGAAVFIVRDGKVVTPPLSDGILDSITRRTAIRLLTQTFDIAVTERSISRTELYTADEIFICGTLDEIRAVGSIDHITVSVAAGPVATRLRELYLDICEGRVESPIPGLVYWI